MTLPKTNYPLAALLAGLALLAACSGPGKQGIQAAQADKLWRVSAARE